MKLSVQYNAPFILTFSFITALFFLFDSIFNNGLSASLGLNLPTSIPLISNVSYVFCHANMEHLFANLSFILLLGPILEEKYGIAKRP